MIEKTKSSKEHHRRNASDISAVVIFSNIIVKGREKKAIVWPHTSALSKTAGCCSMYDLHCMIVGLFGSPPKH